VNLVTNFSEADERWMRFALALSEKAQGFTAENPNVGCVIIDKNGNLCASGFTQKAGRPHAEQVALDKAGHKAINGTMYVTLEPCSHFGKTPPCATAIIESGISRVVIATIDPDKRVNGAGVDMLRLAELQVDTMLLQSEAEKLLSSFLARNAPMHHKTAESIKRKPFITAKIAHTIDGFVSPAKGIGGQISNQVSSAYVHDVRSRVDAVLISEKTARIDNPRLDARIDGINHPTTRIILDRNLLLSADSQLVKTANMHPLVLISAQQADDNHWLNHANSSQNIRLFVVDKSFSLEIIFEMLLEEGFGHILIEPGPRLLNSLLSERLVDEFIEIISPTPLGSGLSINNSEETVAFLPPSPYVISNEFNLADDTLKIWKR
jgi:diaminohydroxyphosphoribosylaminopyrimidine deaminase / 5-amino-6-(5-phosphoribosylamino)uracil reductase